MQAWLARAVIGLNLCPFANAAQRSGGIRWVESTARDEESLLADLVAELHLLSHTPATQIETTLLVHPHALTDFVAYNDFLDIADAALEQLGLASTIQIASFHPQYRFAGSRQDDISNATNRAPYPALHLLRETSIDAAVASLPDAAAIYGRNIATLRRLGWPGWLALWGVR